MLLAVFASGVGMLLSVLFVRYRDVQPIWEVVTQMLFYASPILYVATMVPEEYQRPYLANPIAAILTEMRHAVVDPTAPGAADGDRRRRAAADPARDHRRVAFVARASGRSAARRRGSRRTCERRHATREIERLRARVAELERERAEQAARANAAVAAAQERAYWLDRWHLDLNALMATRRGAAVPRR